MQAIANQFTSALAASLRALPDPLPNTAAHPMRIVVPDEPYAEAFSRRSSNFPRRGYRMRISRVPRELAARVALVADGITDAAVALGTEAGSDVVYIAYLRGSAELVRSGNEVFAEISAVCHVYAPPATEAAVVLAPN
jgi:hypothetical protein